MTRRIPFAGKEHQSREINARHVHHTGQDIAYWGDGYTVMVVVKNPGHPFVEVLDHLADGYRYADYFLPEELANPVTVAREHSRPMNGPDGTDEPFRPRR